MNYRSRIQLLFLLVLPFLFLCLGLSLGGLEPYPAILMPQFGHSGASAGEVQFEEPVVTKWTNGAPVQIPSREMLIGLPPSFLAAVLQNRCRYPNGDTRPEKRLEFIAGGKNYSLRRTSRTWPAYYEEEFHNYLLQNTGADSLFITWQQITRNSTGESRVPLPEQLIINYSTR